MSFEKIICQQCNAPIPWNGIDSRLQCQFCGTVYERNVNKMNMRKYTDNYGKEFLAGYYPPMFHGEYQIRNLGNDMSLNSIEIPVKVFYEMTSDDGEAHILYVSATTYHHIENTLSNAKSQDIIGGDLKRYRRFVGASTYADIRFSEEHPKAENVSVVKIEEPCDKSRESLEKLKAQNQNKFGGKYNNEFAGKIYSYTENSKNQVCLLRLALECIEIPTISDMLGDLFNGIKLKSPVMANNKFGGLFGNGGKNITWTVFNEMYFWGTEESVNKYWDEFEKVYESITLGPDYYKMTNEINRMFNQTSQVIANNNMAMANAQMESNQRMGNMINDTYAYGMNLDRQSWTNTNATMDSVNAMRSEAIRGVNSFSTGNGDFVEADVRFDNVYQNNTYSDMFAGVEGNHDIGSEWTILRKRF